MKIALIFNLQKFCLHDGPGIRTTIFFKGCPLNCLWCHNPESKSYSKQFSFAGEKCSGCGQCEKVCSQEAVKIVDNMAFYEEEKCILCGKCIDVCPNNLREIVGREYTVDQLVNEIEKDRPFYEQSKGGVTLSGGEAMIQIDFVEQLITACKERGISVVVDTCGYAPFSNFLKIMDKVDLFLYDLKLTDPLLHKKYTGQDNQLILDNLRELAKRGAKINLRLPLIEGVNTELCHLEKILELARELKILTINLLPYHDIAKNKYERLKIEYPIEKFSCPSDEKMEEIKSILERAGFQVKIGG